MQEPFCLRCYHFPVCMKVCVEGRRQEIWNGDINKFYKEQARFCDFWEEDAHLKKKNS